ncbi:hypothetical protein DFR58_12526 [Anaerobacterium chartisolvens]|uniref:Uncharacterized protein n=2 Tax=Anaerobacterium chartisolvens TaxID=1297424 RepID=A0A369APT8_9FIRM|nr:hypothetical protein DFR58_12526 [Anaerobacterium chartisolvens]
MACHIKMLRSVSAVFRLIDDFTGKVLNDASFFFLSNGKRISHIRKPEGFFVLVDMEESRDLQIIICSRYYCNYVISGLSVPSESKSIITARLTPGLNYPVPPGASAYSACFTHSSGIPAANLAIELYAPFRDGAVKLKSINTLDNEAYASLSNPYGVDYTGFTLAVPSPDEGDSPLVFSLSSRKDSTDFRIDRPLRKVPSCGCMVKRVYSSVCDFLGRALIPVDYIASPESPDVMEVQLHAFNGVNSYFRDISLSRGCIKHFNEVVDW